MKKMGLVLVGVLIAVSSFGKPAYVDLENGLIFPKKLKGLTFESFHAYDEPALGYSLRYAAGSWHKIDIYVYNLGHDEIPDGPNSEVVKKEARSVSRIVGSMQEDDSYDDVRKLGKTTTPLGGPVRFIKESYQYSQNDIKRLSESYITGYQDNFFKIRFTYHAEHRVRAKKVSDATVKGLIEVMTAEPNRKKTVLNAVAVFKTTPASAAGKSAGEQLMKYATESEAFTLDLPAGVFSWETGDELPENANLLFYGYIAGALEFIHVNGVTRGGQTEGFSLMLDTYVTLREQNEIVKIAKFEEWLSNDDRKALFKTINEAAMKKEK